MSSDWIVITRITDSWRAWVLWECSSEWGLILRNSVRMHNGKCRNIKIAWGHSYGTCRSVKMSFECAGTSKYHFRILVEDQWEMSKCLLEHKGPTEAIQAQQCPIFLNTQVLKTVDPHSDIQTQFSKDLIVNQITFYNISSSVPHISWKPSALWFFEGFLKSQNQRFFDSEILQKTRTKGSSICKFSEKRKRKRKQRLLEKIK